MKYKYLIALLFLSSAYAFCHVQEELKTILNSDPAKNTSNAIYSNEEQQWHQLKHFIRKENYPTQIIRMNNTIQNEQLTCNQFHELVNKILIEKIANDHFIYNMQINCHYDPKTYLADKFVINSYFDPIDNEAIEFLNAYLEEYNGSNFLGSSFNIEPAQGLIISLSIAAGMKKNPKKPPFIEYRKDRSNFFFKNNYEMRKKLFTDVHDHFFSNDPEQILPFLDRWIFLHASSIYKAVLRDSNYVEMQPEQIFLMEHGEKLFVSNLKQYFMHHCEPYENHRCLKYTAMPSS